MTNLIDVTMVILIIFILLAPVIEQGITISLPRTKSKPKFDSPEPIVVEVVLDVVVELEVVEVLLEVVVG